MPSHVAHARIIMQNAMKEKVDAAIIGYEMIRKCRACAFSASLPLAAHAASGTAAATY